MAEQWYAVVNNSTGDLVSIGTVLADPLPKALVAIELGSRPDLGTQLWDIPTRSFVPRPAPPPPKDRVDDIMADGKLAALLPVTKGDMRAAIIANLPDEARYY